MPASSPTSRPGGATQELRVRSASGGAFDCHLAMPAGGAPVPAVVLASAIHGVDADLREIAAAFAHHGYIAAAPDLFWRSLPGPLARGDTRARARAEPRGEKIAAGEQDLADVLRALRALPACNGRAAVIGFCYGGPYAILGPKRLGFDAGMACHGSRMGDYLAELQGVRQPVCIVWGDRDHLAPPEVRDAYLALPAIMANVEVRVLAGVRHGYMMRGNAEAFDPHASAFSMERALRLLEGLAPCAPPDRP